MKPQSFHNTTGAKGCQLEGYEHKAQNQEDVILRFFKENKIMYTPSQALNWLRDDLGNPPLTSIRRAMSNLSTRGLLVKTDKQHTGPYGRPEYYWKLPEPQQGVLI